jgi:hypothetical protein
MHFDVFSHEAYAIYTLSFDPRAEYDDVGNYALYALSWSGFTCL